MTWLAKLFHKVRDIFEFLGRLADDISVGVYAWFGWFMPDHLLAPLSDAFWDMGTFFYEVRYSFDKVAIEVDYWWAVIESVEIKLQNLWNDFYNTLPSLLDQVYNWAWSAYNWAKSALEKAEDALKEIPESILSKLDTAYNWAEAALKEVPAWIQTGLDLVNSSLDSLWAYAKTTVWNKAVEAWNKAANAWNYITDAIVPDIVDAWNKAVAAFTYAAELVDNLNATLSDWVRGKIEGAIAAFLATIAAPINLVNLWFNDIQNFFNDPLGTILSWLEGIVSKHETKMLRIFDKVMDALWR